MTTTAIVKPQQLSPLDHLNQYLRPRKQQLVTYGASDPDRMIQVAMLEFATRDDLHNCSPESIYTSLAISAQLGLVPSSALGEAFLAPFAGKCTLIPGWKGYVKLAHKSDRIRDIGADPVYEADKFRIKLGSSREVEHEPALGADRGKIIGAYAYAVFASGVIDVEWMPIEDLEKVRAVADRYKPSAAYKAWPDQMYRKAPLRRMCKRLPLGEQYARAAAVDDLHDAGQPHRIREVLNLPEEAGEAPTRAPAAQGLANRVGARAAAVRGDHPAANDAAIDVEPVLEETPAGPPTPAELVEMFATCADTDTLKHLVEVRAEIGRTLGAEDLAIVQQAELEAAKRVSASKSKKS